MLEALCAITWALTATAGSRLGGLIASRRGPPIKWALPPLSLRELLRDEAVDASGKHLIPLYISGIVLSSMLFIGAAARRLL